MRTDNLPLEGNYVLNLDSSEGPGTHWVAVYGDEYYDSFGVDPPKILAKKRVINYNQTQDLKSNLCGLYACLYIFLRNRNMTPYDTAFRFIPMLLNK